MWQWMGERVKGGTSNHPTLTPEQIPWNFQIVHCLPQRTIAGLQITILDLGATQLIKVYAMNIVTQQNAQVGLLSKSSLSTIEVLANSSCFK